MKERYYYSVIAIVFITACFIINENAYCDISNFYHHVIVIIDRSGSMDNTEGKMNGFKTIIRDDLEKICFKQNEFFQNRKLLDDTKGDYLSVISFGMEKIGPNFKKFIHPISIPNKKKKDRIRYKLNFYKGFFSSTLRQIIESYDREDFFTFNYTGLTMSIPLGVHALKDSSYEVHKTIIIQISDDIANTTVAKIPPESRWVYEIKALKWVKNYKFANKICNQFFKHYSIKDLRIIERNAMKIKVMELVPKIAENIEIESVLHYNHEPVFKRIRIKGGVGYGLANYSIKPINKKKFLITDAEIAFFDQHNNQLSFNSHGYVLSELTFNKIESEKRISIAIKKEKLMPSKCYMRMKYRVKLNENVYGVQVLYPEQSAGLIRKIPIALEKQRKFWWFFPLSDNLFYYTFMPNQQIAVMVLNILGLIIAIPLTFYLSIFIIKIALFKNAQGENNIDAGKISI